MAKMVNFMLYVLFHMLKKTPHLLVLGAASISNPREKKQDGIYTALNDNGMFF